MSVLLLTACASPSTLASQKASAKLPATVRQKVFDIVWTKVRDKHYDPKLNGLDWVAVRKRYLPKALGAPTDTAFYETLNQMLGELKQSHLGVLPPATVHDASMDSATVPGDRSGQTGIQALLVGDRIVVTEVEEKSGAAEANIHAGMTLVSINDKPLAAIIKRLQERKPPLREGELRVDAWMAARTMLAGPIGKTVKIVAKADSETETTYTVTRKAPLGQILTFGALPPLPANVETKTLEGGIGYIRFNIFLLPLMDSIRKAMNDFSDAKAPGIILDLRGNPGGVGAMACAVSGMFTTEQVSLGVMNTRAAELRFPVFPQSPRYRGPVAVLTDESSLSTSEILAAGLQEIKRAVVIGRTTGGMVLPSQVEELPGGGEFQYVFADYHTPKGVRLEGKGVTPDILVDMNPSNLLNHPDPVISAGIDYINQHKPAQQ